MSRRWRGSIDLKSQQVVDYSLDRIVAEMRIPSDVGRPAWSRNRRRGPYNPSRRWNKFDNGQRERYFGAVPVHVKRLRDREPWDRPRGWNQWNRRRSPPNYSGWFNRRRRHNQEDDWEDDDGDGSVQSFGSRGCYMDREQNRRRSHDRDCWNRRRDGWSPNFNRYDGYRRRHRGFDGYRRGNSQDYRERRAWNGDRYNDRLGSRNDDRIRDSKRRDRREGGGPLSERFRRISRDSRSSPTPSNASSKAASSHAPTIEEEEEEDASPVKEVPRKYKPLPSSSRPLQWPTLLISNLHPTVTDLDIYDLFREFGNLKRANVHHDRTGKSLQTADVVFFSEEDARKALLEYDNTVLDGFSMRIFLCNSCMAPSLSASTTNRSKASNNTFRIKDIPHLDANQNSDHYNFAHELKSYKIEKPKVPLKQGKWWRQNHRDDF